MEINQHSDLKTNAAMMLEKLLLQNDALRCQIFNVVSLFVGKILAEQLNVAAINCAHTVFVDSLRQVSISFFITTGIIIEDLVF